MKSLLCILVSILSGCSVTVVTCRCSFVCVDRVMTLSEGGHFVAVLRGTYAYPGVGTDVSWMWEWLLQSLGTWTLWRWLWLHRAQRTATEAMLGRLSHPGSVGQWHVTGWHNAELSDSGIWSSVHCPEMYNCNYRVSICVSTGLSWCDAVPELELADARTYEFGVDPTYFMGIE